MLLPSAIRDRPKLRDVKIDRREQPNGEAGVRFSLDQVAKKISEGRLSPQVRAWAMRQLDAAGNPKGPLARAKVLLEATRGNRTQGRWAPDPTDAEFIPDADLMVSTCKDDKIGENGVCELEEIASYFALGDCDDLTVQFGSSVLAPMIMLAAAGNAGVYGAVVGHAYDEGKHIQHVLAAIYAEGRWHYCDPSLPDMPFGECKPFTRERIIYVPSLEVGCDADVCLKPGGQASGPPSFASKGEFIGVSGVEELEIPEGLEPFVELETTGIGALGSAAIVANDVGSGVVAVLDSAVSGVDGMSDLGRGGGHGGGGGHAGGGGAWHAGGNRSGHGGYGRHGGYRGRIWWNDGWNGAGWWDWPWAYALGPDYEADACSADDALGYIIEKYGAPSGPSRRPWWRDAKVDNGVLSVLASDGAKATAELPASVCGYKVVVTTLGTPKNAPTLGRVWYDYR
jgi:hypothetical protein